MAEETFDTPKNPVKIVIESGHIRRNSTGNLRTSMRRMKVLPRYLSDSVSSCHDFCKYGIKQDLEKKAINPILKRIKGRPGEERGQAEDVNPEVKKKKSVISRKPLVFSKTKTAEEHNTTKTNTPVLSKKTAASADSKSQTTTEEHKITKKHTPLFANKTAALADSKRQTTTEEHKITKKNTPVLANKTVASGDSKSQTTTKEHKITKKNTSLVANKMPVSSKPVFSPGDKKDVSAKHASDSRAKTLQTKQSSFSTMGRLSSRIYSEFFPNKTIGDVQASPVGDSSRRRQSTIGTSKEMKGSRFGKKTDLLPPSVSPSPKPSAKREPTAKPENLKDPNQGSQVKSQRTVSKAESKPIDKNVPEKTLYVIQTKPEDPIMGLTQNGNGMSHSSQNPSKSPTSTKKPRHARKGISISRSSSSSSRSSEKKSLRRIKTGNRTDASSSSSLSLLSSSDSMNSDGSYSISKGSGTKNEKRMANPQSNYTSRPQRVGKVISADKIASPRKLNFARGKVIEIQARNTSPRRLRFKQRMLLGENQNSMADSERRKLKEVVAIGDLNGSETKPTNVVLRHQDVEGKKGGQSLLNNVIEETASKLVQTRKSKVKALVGAFETVISLQDNKSSSAKG